MNQDPLRFMADDWDQSQDPAKRSRTGRDISFFGCQTEDSFNTETEVKVSTNQLLLEGTGSAADWLRAALRQPACLP